MSALPLKADIRRRIGHVRQVPEADIVSSIESARYAQRAIGRLMDQSLRLLPPREGHNIGR